MFSHGVGGARLAANGHIAANYALSHAAIRNVAYIEATHETFKIRVTLADHTFMQRAEERNVQPKFGRREIGVPQNLFC